MTTDLQPTDYAVTLAAWRERHKGLWRGTVESVAEMRQVTYVLAWCARVMWSDLRNNPRLTRALYAAIQAEGRR